MNTAVPGSSYKGRDLAAILYAPELDRIGQLPGVKAAGFDVSTLGSRARRRQLRHCGTSESRSARHPRADLNAASENYFRALEISLIQGRFFSAADVLSRPRVVIVNDALSKRYFAGQDPIGKQVAFDDPDSQKHSLTIVGVVRASRQMVSAEPPNPELYLCYRQITPDTLWSDFLLKNLMTYVVRTEGNPAVLANAMQSSIHAMDPGQTIYEVSSMKEVVSASIKSRRLSGILLGILRDSL